MEKELRHPGGEKEKLRVQLSRKERGRKILLYKGRRAPESRSLRHDGDAASPGRNDDLSRVEKCLHRIELDDLPGLRGGNEPLEGAVRERPDLIASLLLFLCLFPGKPLSDQLSRVIEAFVVGIDARLRENGADRPRGSPPPELRAKGILNIIADEALTHRGADGERRRAIALRITAPKLLHRRMDESKLRGI